MTQSADGRRAQTLLSVVRALTLVALASSSAAAVDQYGASPAFCGEGSGCAVVRASALGRLLGDALPSLGLLGFGLVLLASLARRPVLQRLTLAAAVAGGVAGLTLAGLQLWVVGRMCGLCMITDAAAAGAGCVALLALRDRNAVGAPSRLTRHATLASAVLAALVPPAWALARPPEPPPYVRAAAARGGLVVVELSDFECPFCRAMHPALMEALKPYGSRVRLVRKSVPLPGHRYAFGAAMAQHCAEAQGHGEAMADVLFTSERLALGDCVEHARALGLELQRFERCLADPVTRAAIEHGVAEVRRAGLAGLPTVYIGSEPIIGFDAEAGAARYAEALARAARGESGTALRWPLAAVLALALLVLAPGLRRTRAQ